MSLPAAFAQSTPSTTNTAPTFDSTQSDVTLDIGDGFNYSILASDPDNDPITFSVNSDLSSWLNFESNPVQSAFAGTGIPPITNGGVYDSPDGTAATEANLSIFAYGLSAVDGKVFFGDQEEFGIRYVDENGAIQTLIAGDGSSATLQAAGIVHDPATNTTYFGDYAANEVYKSVNGGAKQLIASGLNSFILGMALDKANNNLYVSARNAIYEIDLTNNAVRKIIGSGASQGSYSDTGVASTSEVNQPHGLTFDNDGRLVFADRFNDIIRRIDIAKDTVETLAGIQGTSAIGGDGGPATAATFADPTGVAIDAKGRIFITERLASVVRMIDVDGNIDQFASVTGVGFLDSLTINEDGELLIGGSQKIVQVNTTAKVFGVTSCDAIGDHDVTITVADDGGLSATQSFVITVADSTEQCKPAALNKIQDYADDSVSNPAPSVPDYAAAGVTGVSNDNLSLVNDVIASQVSGDLGTSTAIQAFVDQLVGSLITDQATLANIINDLTADYLITSNISIDPSTWTSLGSEANPFTGSIESADPSQPFQISGLTDEPLFDVIGAGAKVAGINIVANNSTAPAGSGLLANKIEGTETNKAEISDITISSNSVIDGGSNNQIGGLAGTADHVIFSNITMDGDVSGNDQVGGLAGTISNSTATNISVGGEISGVSLTSAVGGESTNSSFTGLTVTGTINGPVALDAADLTLSGTDPSITGEIAGATGSLVAIDLQSNGANFATSNAIDVETLTHTKGTATIAHSVTTDALVLQTTPSDPSTGKLTIQTGGVVETSTLNVSSINSGRLVVAAGGQLTSTTATVASATSQNQTGGITVEGANAQWVNAGNLTIGRPGFDRDGQLLIADGGQVIGKGTTVIEGSGDIRVAGSDSILRVDTSDSGGEGQGTLTLETGGRLVIGAQQGLSAAEPGAVDVSKVVLNGGATLVFNHSDNDHVFEPVIEGGGVINIEAGTTQLAGGFAEGSELGQIQIQTNGQLKVGATQTIDPDHLFNWIGGGLQLGIDDKDIYGRVLTAAGVNLPATAAIDLLISDCDALISGTIFPGVIESTTNQLNAGSTSFQVTDNCSDFEFEAVVNGQAIDLNATKKPSALFTQGDGTSSDPYQISNWEQLAAMGQLLDKDFVLIESLNKDSVGYASFASEAANNATGFAPIGSLAFDGNGEVDASNSTLFTGSLEGGGNTISDLVIERPTVSGVAVFAGLGSQATIENLSLENVSVTGNEWVAGLAAYNQGNLTNVSISGEMNGDSVVAGVVAEHVGNGTEGIIDQVSADVVVDATTATAGGLVAVQKAGEIKQSYVGGEVGAGNQAGGLVGLNDGGSITQSYSKNKVSGTGSDVGGLVGAEQSISGMPVVTTSFWDEESSGQTSSAGGTGASKEAMTSFDLYDQAWNDNQTTHIVEGWADATDTSVTAVWGQCSGVNDGYPFKLTDYVSSACTAGAPIVNSIEERNGALMVAFDAPTDTGGGTVSNYEYQLNGGDWVAFDPAITSSPATITGLTNGTDYSVKLRAVTNGGGGDASNAKTGNPFAAPSAPQNVVVISRPGGLQVVWDFSVNNGGRAITVYRVLIDGEVACEVAASEDSMACNIEGLSAGEAYAVEVLAVTDSAITPSAQDNQVQATPTAIIPVPTLSVWALLVLMLSLMGLSLSRLRRLN